MKIRNIIVSLCLAAASTVWAGPKYVFYFIGDGMGMGQIMAAHTYNRVALGNDSALQMMRFPYAGILTTYSASSTVTDSAAAGTALATGHKTNNGVLGLNADSVAVTSMAKILHDNGWGVALVTTVAPDDATPGAFYAHVPNRGMYYEIGRQAADCGYEFMASSTWRGATDKKSEPTDLMAYISSRGVDVVTTIDDAKASKSRRVFLHSADPFNSSNVGFTIDSIPGALTLPDMTETAIEHMNKVSPDKFFMMVEGGNIDHVGHGNDGGTVAVEVVNFDQALAKAYDFYLQHPDETVIIVTADHETGGLSIGNGTVGYTSHTEYIPYQRMSKDMFSRKGAEFLKNGTPSWEDVKRFTAECTGLWSHVPVSEKQEAELKALYDRAMSGNTEQANEKTLYASYSALASEIYRVLNTNQGFGWTTGGHSGNPVPVFAIGNGMEMFGAFLDNTQIAPMLLDLINK